MYKIGNSIDIHRLVKGNNIKVGGVNIPSSFTSISYSDGDALLHAVAESILGALGLKDLGENYPNTDIKYKNIDSCYFINDVKNKLIEYKYKISNIDIMIVLESIKLKDYKELIESNIASLLNIDKELVNVKAGSNEGIGSIGNNESYLVWVSTLIEHI